MRPIDLYRMEPQDISRSIGKLHGSNYDHLEELTRKLNVFSYYGLEDANEKVEIRYYAHYFFDERREWRLASVWFEDKPVMIIQNAGREGDDHARRYITDENAFKQMLDYIEFIIQEGEEDPIDVVSEDDDIEELDTFYGHTLASFYDLDFVPEFKVGDEVEALIATKKPYGYISESTEMKKVKVEITEVRPSNPYDTYLSKVISEGGLSRYIRLNKDLREI